MCSNYEAVHNNTRLRQHFGVPHAAPAAQAHVWPGYVGTFIRRSPTASTSHSATPEREAMAGRFGLIPAWAKDPDGHFKFPHLWPPQIPPGKTGGL